MKRKDKEGQAQALAAECRLALGEMRSAKNSFDCAVSPELVEESIYRYNAASRRYAFARKRVSESLEENGDEGL
jgi:hypothetical protein